MWKLPRNGGECFTREQVCHEASIIVVNCINKKTVEQISMYYYGEGVNIMIYCYICKKKVNVVTCDYKSQCSHMWEYWLL